MPGAAATSILGIQGSNIVGYYDTPSASHGYLYNMTTQSCTMLDFPSSPSMTAYGTQITGIDGSNLVGKYWYHNDSVYSGGPYGFYYNMTTESWTALNMPTWAETTGISGDYVVGSYMGDSDPISSHGFLYNLTAQSWVTLDMPGTSQTRILGINGTTLFGSADNQGFLYDMTTQNLTTLSMSGAHVTEISGISGDNIVGNYWDASYHWHGFLYNTITQSRTTLDPPGGWWTRIEGIDGSNIVGYYENTSDGYYHGFVYTIPEPTTFLLFGMGTLLLRKSKRRIQKLAL